MINATAVTNILTVASIGADTYDRFGSNRYRYLFSASISAFCLLFTVVEVKWLPLIDSTLSSKNNC